MLEASIILSFYNDLPLLRLLLDALATQYTGQFEVLIADDGSEPFVVQQLKRLLPTYPFMATHLWHTDQGFRKTVILNRAVVAAQKDYLIFVDADCVPQAHFVDDHLRVAHSGLCQSGRRVNVAREAVDKLDCTKPAKIVNRNLGTLLRWSYRGCAQALEKGLRLPPSVADQFSDFSHGSLRGILGCNFSISRHDLLSVNGFDERFSVPWGAEDSDLERRLRKAGLQFKNLRYQATMIHFDASYDRRRRGELRQTSHYFELVKQENRAWTPYGILKEDRADPVTNPATEVNRR
jgi:glycosyltransferase involved in cell wall biosynthesis